MNNEFMYKKISIVIDAGMEKNRKRIIKLGNFNIMDISFQGVTNVINKRLNNHEKGLFFFANTNFIVKCQPLHLRIKAAPSIVVNDGIGMQLANNIVNRLGFYQNLNGTDLLPNILDNIQDKRIVLLGSKDKDLKLATDYINSHFSSKVVGSFNGYEDVKDPNLFEKINQCQPDLVLVGMGNPIQEEWMLDHYEKVNASLFFGVGALFVFMAGNVKRAPAIMRKYRLEWLYRLYNEPRRLFKRYTIDIVKFLLLCFKYKEKQ